MRTVSSAAVLVAVTLLVLAMPVLAAAEVAVPWDQLEIAIGPVVLVWGAVVAGVVQVLKGVKIGDPPRPLLGSPQAIWLANLLLGGVGVLVYEVTNGAALLQAVVNGVLAVLSASGLFEAVKTAAGNSTSGASGAATQ